MADWKGESWNPNIVNFDQFKELKEVKHLDVRNIPEFVQTGVINNSILIPLPELHKRVVELKGEKNLVVSCRTGARARVAQSILAQEGIEAIVLSERTIFPIQLWINSKRKLESSSSPTNHDRYEFRW